MSGKRYACPDVLRRVSEGPPVSPALPAALGPRRRAAKDSRGLPTITADLKPACRRKVGGTTSLPAAHESLAPRVRDPTLSTAERAGGVGGALGNPSSYGGTGVPATDRRAVGQTVRSGFPRPHPPGGSAAIGSPQFRTETLRTHMVRSASGSAPCRRRELLPERGQPIERGLGERPLGHGRGRVLELLQRGVAEQDRRHGVRAEREAQGGLDETRSVPVVHQHL